MKNKKRTQILLRILSKSNEIMDDIVQLNMQIYSPQTWMNKPLDKINLFAPKNSTSDTKNIKEYRNIFIEQWKESAAKLEIAY